MKPTAPPLTLQGIFLSSHSAKAVIQTEGLRKMYVEGDSLPGGWRIRAIDTSGVGIERCDQRKCASKFLSLAD
jgi:type II secretory pathway component PulC